MLITSFTQLNVWKGAHQLVLDLYRDTAHFPADERYRPTDQMLKAAISIPANIAEGFARLRRPDKARFYNISQGSASELKYYLILARALGYLPPQTVLDESLEEVCRMLYGLASALRSDR